jgi:RNA polymerase sigma-70 factor, ECF subfamily
MSARVEELYKRFGPLVFRRCLSILKDEESAYDALQEVFLKLMRSTEAMDRMITPVAYLYRMATNVSLNALKRDRSRAARLLSLADELPDEREEGLAAPMLLELLSVGLGERTKAIAYCRYVDGMGLDEIAEHVELSRSAVRKQLDKFKAHARRHKERVL